MNAEANSQEFEKTIQGDDFDFDFDEDFESETKAEYSVMDAMRFDREAGTASCNFELEEEDEADPMAAFSAGNGATDESAKEADAKKPTAKSKKRG